MRGEECCDDKHLHYYLLHGLKTLVLLFLYLDKIVNKADKAEQQSHYNGRYRLCELLRAYLVHIYIAAGPHYRNARRKRDYNTSDEHNSAHSRCAVL